MTEATSPPPVPPSGSVEPVAATGSANMPPPSASGQGTVRVVYDLPLGVLLAIQGMAEVTGETPEEILKRSVALYSAGLKYHREGKLIGAASSEDGLDVIFKMF